MSKLAGALGINYEAKRQDLRIRKFELGGHTFRVKVPLVAESDAMYKRIMEPDEAKVEAVYQEMIAPLDKFKDKAEENGFEFVEGDVLVNGRSLRETAKTKVMTETRIVELVKLLVPEVEGATMDDVTYEDIQAEWPMSVQLALIEKISEQISPTYKEARGN